MKHCEVEKVQSPPAAGRTAPRLETARLPGAEAATEERQEPRTWLPHTSAGGGGAGQATDLETSASEAWGTGTGAGCDGGMRPSTQKCKTGKAAAKDSARTGGALPGAESTD